MWKIIILLFISLFLFNSYSEGSKPSFVSLWKSEEVIIQGILPREWRPLTSGEVAKLVSVVPEDIINQSGDIVSAFKFSPESPSANLSYNPQIIVFIKTGEHVNKEMIQKTYLWLKKNENLVTNIFSDKGGNVGIQNIEYNQKLPAILFQNKISVSEHYFTELSSIIFLKNNIMNIVCLAEEKEFAEYETVFHSFIESIVIPMSLRHEAVIHDQPATTMLTDFFMLLDKKWQPILGVLLIIGIYGLVFRTRREKVQLK